MAETKQIAFTHKEVVEALLKQQGIHEGIWSLYVEFGLGAVNVGASEDSLLPAAVIPVLKIGLQKADKVNSLSVDAARVNPRVLAPKKTTRRAAKRESKAKHVLDE
jgi:hypothetical protein